MNEFGKLFKKANYYTDEDVNCLLELLGLSELIITERIPEVIPKYSQIKSSMIQKLILQREIANRKAKQEQTLRETVLNLKIQDFTSSIKNMQQQLSKKFVNIEVNEEKDDDEKCKDIFRNLEVSIDKLNDICNQIEPNILLEDVETRLKLQKTEERLKILSLSKIEKKEIETKCKNCKKMEEMTCRLRSEMYHMKETMQKEQEESLLILNERWKKTCENYRIQMKLWTEEQLKKKNKKTKG
eukprot:TRINITY_DN2213_c0_g1_i1.p1 TRINITY_DN2213_c0_g1~~TRINITY_DN2213_c0_g1_i1.p1  ORF type:complete len:242 (-),score=70.69 TRINITY_DN2213_c0_g1_i1:119-844(-)